MRFQFKTIEDAMLTVSALHLAADRYREDAKNAAADATYPPPLRKSLEQQFLQQEATARRIAAEIEGEE